MIWGFNLEFVEESSTSNKHFIADIRYPPYKSGTKFKNQQEYSMNLAFKPLKNKLFWMTDASSFKYWSEMKSKIAKRKKILKYKKFNNFINQTLEHARAMLDRILTHICSDFGRQKMLIWSSFIPENYSNKVLNKLDTSPHTQGSWGIGRITPRLWQSPRTSQFKLC